MLQQKGIIYFTVWTQNTLIRAQKTNTINTEENNRQRHISSVLTDLQYIVGNT